MSVPISPAGNGVEWHERRWVFGFAVLVIILTSLPYLLGFSVQGDSHVYTGFFFGVQDGNSYIAKMLNGTYGAWMFRSSHTAYTQRGELFFPLFILLGKLASPPGLHDQLVALFQLFRCAAVLLSILATYDFIAFFVADVRVRRFGLALVALGSGLGWLLVLFGQQHWLGSLPLDFYSPEAFGFLSLFGIPHLALARAFLLWALLVYLRTVRAGTGNDLSRLPGTTLKLCCLWLLTGLAQPLSLLVLGVVLVWHLAGLAVWQTIRNYRGLTVNWTRWRRLAVMVISAGILPGIFLLYNTWVYYSDPYVRVWFAQDHLSSPHPFHYLLAYGLLLPYAFWGGRRLWRTDAWVGWLPLGWVILFPLLVYFPLDMQRRLPEGVWVAWITLAMLTIEDPKLQTSRKRLISLPLVLLFTSAALFLVSGLLTTSRPDVPLFRPKDEVRVFEFLQSKAQPGAVVLAAFETGNPLPAWAPAHVLIGLGAESIHLSELMPRVAEFYSIGTSDEQRLELIRQFGVRYVFWGPAERALGGWSPDQAGYLRPVFQAGDYRLFQVANNP